MNNIFIEVYHVFENPAQRSSFTGCVATGHIENNNSSRPNNFRNASLFPIKRSESKFARVRLQILSTEVVTEVACNSSYSALLKEFNLKVMCTPFRDTKRAPQHRFHHDYRLR